MSNTKITPAHIDQIRALAAAGRTIQEISGVTGISTTAIDRHAKARNIAIRHAEAVNEATRQSRALVDQIRAQAAEGRTGREIAEALGTTADRIRDTAYRHGIEVTAGYRSGRTDGRTLAVPDWVPRDLQGEYRDFARDLGRTYAERAIRRLIHDARGAA